MMEERATDGRDATSIPAAPVGQTLAWRRDLPVVVVLLIVAWVFAEARVWRTPGFFAGDLITQFVPYYTELGERLRSGDIPGWNASLFSGAPFAGDPISGWGYLPVMLAFVALPPVPAYVLFVGVHLALTGVATYLLARALGLGPFGAAVAGLVFMLGPQMHHAGCCTARFQIGPWAPLGLLAIEGALRCRGRVPAWRWSILGGVVIAQMIAGYVGKGMLYGGMLVAAWLLYRVVLDPPSTLRAPAVGRRLVDATLLLGGMLAIALGLGAAVILPRLQYLGASNLAGGSYDGIPGDTGVGEGWALDRLLWTITSVRAPAYFAGAVVVAVAVVGALLLGGRSGARFFALAATVIASLAVGDSIVTRAFSLLPTFREIHEHEPHRVLMLLSFPLAMLAGGLVDALPRQRWPWTRVARSVAIATGVAVIAIGITDAADRAIDGRMRSLLLAAPATIGLLALAPRIAARPGVRASAGTLGSLALAVLLVASADRDRLWPAIAAGWAVVPPTSPAAEFLDPDDAAGAGGFLRDRLLADGPFRYVGFDDRLLSADDAYLGDNYRRFWRDPAAALLLVDNRALTLELQDVQGYNPVQFAAYIAFIDAINGQPQEYHETNILPPGFDSPLWRLLNVRYIVVPATVSPDSAVASLVATYPTVFASDHTRVLAVTDALPRFWTVHATQVVAPGGDLAALAAPGFDPRITAILTAPLPAPIEPAAAAGDRIDLVSYGDDDIVLDVTMASAGLLVASEVMADGWVATIDGARTDIVATDGILRGIVVPAGAHRVEMHYRPTAIGRGVAISVGTAIGLALALVGASLLPPRRRPRRA